MRLSEASVHLTSFSTRIKDESLYMPTNILRDGILKAAWISSTAAKAAEAMLTACPSAYEKRCLLQLLAATDFGDGGSTSIYFQRLHWKINLAEPSLRKDDDLYLGNETLGDDTLLAALENHGRWDQARNWARQLESTGASWKYAVHHVTETQVFMYFFSQLCSPLGEIFTFHNCAPQLLKYLDFIFYNLFGFNLSCYSVTYNWYYSFTRPLANFIRLLHC